MRVLIVGAGIAGLATARALRGVGIDCDVVERDVDWARDGTGIYLPANAIRALRLLGLAAAVADRGAAIPRQRFLNHRGRLLTDVDLSRVWGPTDPCIALPRSVLHDVLRGRLHEHVRMGTTVLEIRAAADRVDVSFSDGTTQPYELVVGADGIHSDTRRLLLGTADESVVQPVGQVAWRFVTECPAQVSTWSVMLGRGSAFLTIPIGAGRVYCYADVSTPDAASGDLAMHFASYAEPVPTVLAALSVEPMQHGPIEEVVLERWAYGRVLLIGDAAHATSPNMAQGAAMAMEDALVLARCLAGSSDVEAGLGDFQEQRRTRTDWVRAQTHRRDRTRDLPVAVRNAGLRLAGQRIFRANYAPLVAAP